MKQAASRNFIVKHSDENVTYFLTAMKFCLVLEVSVTSPSVGLLKSKKRKYYFNLLTTFRRCGWKDGL